MGGFLEIHPPTHCSIIRAFTVSPILCHFILASNSFGVSPQMSHSHSVLHIPDQAVSTTGDHPWKPQCSPASLKRHPLLVLAKAPNTCSPGFRYLCHLACSLRTYRLLLFLRHHLCVTCWMAGGSLSLVDCAPEWESCPHSLTRHHRGDRASRDWDSEPPCPQLSRYYLPELTRLHPQRLVRSHPEAGLFWLGLRQVHVHALQVRNWSKEQA